VSAESAGTRGPVDAAAFDLGVSERGAVLAWVEAAPAEMLHVVRLDVPGEVQTRATQQLRGRVVTDLVLADTAAGTSVLWRETSGGTATARGVWVDSAGAARALELGPAWGDAQAGRGNLSVTTRGAGALALVRGPREACGEGSEGGSEGGSEADRDACFGFRFYELSPSGAALGGLNLRVPVPCDARAALLISPRPLAGPAAASEPRFHYAVCTRSEQAPVLTVFSIEPDRGYAAARQVFSGCTPLGAGYFAGEPQLIADCRGSRQIARIPAADAAFEVRNIDGRGLLCGPRGPRLRLANDWLELDRPTEHLELLLDASLAPLDARAVWTGSVLLVARAQAGRLTLARYGCSGSELRQLSGPLD